MNHLQVLPFDEIKIDRSFIHSMTRLAQSRKIVASIVGLANSLGMISVAEGVETDEQAGALLWLGCEEGQGWLYSRAVPASQVPALIDAAPRPLPIVVSAQNDTQASMLDSVPTRRLPQLRAIYEGTPIGLCFLDLSLRYVNLNQRHADIAGLPVAEHVGKRMQEILPSLFSKLEPNLLRSLCGESVQEIEISTRRERVANPAPRSRSSANPRGTTPTR